MWFVKKTLSKLEGFYTFVASKIYYMSIPSSLILQLPKIIQICKYEKIMMAIYLILFNFSSSSVHPWKIFLIFFFIAKIFY